MKHQEIAPKGVPGRAATVCHFVNRFGRTPGGRLLAKAGSIVPLGLSDGGIAAENPASMINP
ncbi:MAG: hypothetical protein ABSF51_07555 [Verrucomicrobiota bacterium]|jgi:hypothetical protein